MSSSFQWDDLMQAADDAGFTVVPAMAGVSARVATATAAKTSDGKKDQIKVRFTLEEGPYAGKSVFNNFVISPENGSALGFFFRHMAALGLTREWFATKPSMAQVAEALVGRECLIDIVIDTWVGEERNKVSAVKPPRNGSNPAPRAMSGGMPTPGVPGPVPSSSPVPTTPATSSLPTVPATPMPATGSTTPPPLPF